MMRERKETEECGKDEGDAAGDEGIGEDEVEDVVVTASSVSQMC
jgi:hypothetical protein